MSIITRERAQEIFLGNGPEPTASEERELARIALASLEAEVVGEVVLGEYDDSGCHPDARVACIAADGQADWENFKDGTRLYAAPSAPVMPDSGREQFEEWFKFHHGEEGSIVTLHRANGDANYRDEFVDLAWIAWKDSCAAMLKGADGALANEDTKLVGELVMWVKRLAHSLRKANPDSKLQIDAMDYLSRKGLIGVEDILR